MIATTVMAVVILTWCARHAGGPAGRRGSYRPWPPTCRRKSTPKASHRSTRLPADRRTRWASWARRPPARLAATPPGVHWLSLIGVIGIIIAFGHSILAMSGEETLAQVYREVESPKLPNFKKAAFIVFLYSLLLTALISFLAVHAHPRRGPAGRLQGQPDRRPGDERGRPEAGPAGLERVRGGRRLPDPGRGGQHGDHRLQRRA